MALPLAIHDQQKEGLREDQKGIRSTKARQQSEEVRRIGHLPEQEQYKYLQENPPVAIKHIKMAREKWEEIFGLYAENPKFTFVNTGDIGIITQYCVLWADFWDTCKLKKDLLKGIKDAKEKIDALKDTSIDSQINQKSSQLVRLAKCLYLEPTSRVTPLGRQKKADENAENKLKRMFGN